MEEGVVAGIRRLLKTAKARGLTDEDINRYLKENGYSFTSRTNKKTDEVVEGKQPVPYKTRACSLINLVAFKLSPALLILYTLLYPLFNGMVAGSTCLVTHLSPFGEVIVPLANCDMCRGVHGAPRLSNLSREDFVRHYAYSSRPILVEGAVLNWSAVEVFSYDYFKDLYLSVPGSLEEDNFTGQFFAYNSNVGNLKELFSLPVEVASMQAEKWYVGW